MCLRPAWATQQDCLKKIKEKEEVGEEGRKKVNGDTAQEVAHLPSKYGALSSSPSTTKKKEGRKKGREEGKKEEDGGGRLWRQRKQFGEHGQGRTFGGGDIWRAPEEAGRPEARALTVARSS
jgi:hypothetical protein